MTKNALKLLFVMLPFSVAYAQTPPSNPPSPPAYSVGPLTEYSAAQPDTTDVLRFRRGERYNIPDLTVPELGETSEPIGLQSETHFRRDPLPFDNSDAVVVGTVKTGQAYLSNDKRRLYSEFKVELQDVIKMPTGPYLMAGDSIAVQREGGKVRLPSGKVLVRAATANSMPQIGKRYLLFLKYNSDTQDYALVTGYQLGGGQVYRLDERKFEEDNHQRVEHPLREKSKSEDEFLAHVKSAFLSRRKGS
jgi:hypothetical protein